jgi:L-fuculose-phosphate aldolase
MDTDDIRFRIAAARRMLYRQGCDSNIGGHVSARADGEDAFWVTGLEYFDQTTPDRVCKLGFDLDCRVGSMDFSPAVNFHAAIYQRRADVDAIVHLHSRHLSVLSSTGRTIGMYNVVSVLFSEEQATYADDGVRPHLDVVDALGEKRVVLMQNHGGIVASQSLEQATIEAIMLEEAARYHLECEAVGGKEIAEAEVLSGRRAYHKHFLPAMWDRNLDRLRASDPDLFEHVG